jgi:hypothetical protein
MIIHINKNVVQRIYFIAFHVASNVPENGVALP